MLNWHETIKLAADEDIITFGPISKEVMDKLKEVYREKGINNMKGETTLSERAYENLKRIEDVFKLYKTRYSKDFNDEDFVFQLISDATYYATYSGVELDLTAETAIVQTREFFPDIP